MRILNIHFLIFTFLVLTGCASSARSPVLNPTKVEEIYSIPAEVVNIDGDLATLLIEKPALFEGSTKLAFALAKGIVEKSYLFTGTVYELGKHRGKLEKIRGNEVVFTIPANNTLMPGDKTKIFLEKKVIAIRDFEVIRGRNKDIATYIQEDITTALVSSGQFDVVERLKLKTVLEELKFQLSGAVDSKTAKKVGKMVGADFILTGTMASVGEEWNVNLRLINTESGLITAAINKVGPLSELKAEKYRSMKNIDAGFENGELDLSGWLTGNKLQGITGKDGSQDVAIDDATGANGTQRSLKLVYTLGSKRTDGHEHHRVQCRIRNRLSRDLTEFSAIKFSIKSDRKVTVRFTITDSEEKLQNEENWIKNVVATNQWKAVSVPFNSLSLLRGKAKREGTNHILELTRIEKIDWIVDERNVGFGSAGILWIDEVSFY